MAATDNTEVTKVAGLFTSSFQAYLDNNALAFNSLLYNKIISATAQNLPLAALAFGMGDRAEFLPDGRLSFPRVENVQGIKKEIQFSGKLLKPTVLLNQQDEVSRQQNQYQKGIFASREWDLTHLYLPFNVAQSDIDKLEGKPLKTQNYLDSIIDVISESWAEDLTDWLHFDSASSRGRGGNQQSAAAVGSLAYMIDESTDYPFDRSDSANSKFRSYVNASTGSLTLPTLGLAQNYCYTRGGKNTLGLCDVINYNRVQQLVQNKITLREYNPSLDKFGGQYVQYGSTTFVLDQKTGGGEGTVIYILTPEDFLFVFKDQMMVNGRAALIEDPTTPAGYIMRTRAYVGAFCKRPWAQAKLLAVS